MKNIRITAFLLLCNIACACMLPNADRIIDEASEKSSQPKIMGAEGPLSADQSKILLTGIGINDHFKRHLAIEQAITETPLVMGNKTRVLRDGVETIPAIFSSIRRAKSSINLEYFIFEDVLYNGEKLSNLLVKKRRQGVEVNIIYDSFGSSDTKLTFFDRLKKAGVKLVQFNPLNPLESKNGYSPNNRDHRKILITDGSTAIVGGVNLSTHYQKHLFGKSAGPKEDRPRYWRDTDLEIKGPVVAQLQNLFLQHWKEQKGPLLNKKKFFPKISNKGQEVVRVIGSTPDKAIPRYYISLLSGIRNAQINVWLMTAYFVPTCQEIADLMDAARRGVDVRILVPDKSDSKSSLSVQHSYYSDLMEAGVKIYESQNEVLHSKMVVIDGIWSVIGSSNFDYRSVIFNDEVDVVVLGKHTGNIVENMFEDDFEKAHHINLEAWKKRPLSEKFHETIVHVWKSML